MIDVHGLAGELGVSSAVILRAAADLGGTVSGGSTLSEELASQIRSHLRGAQRGFVGSGGSPMFSVGAQRSAASRREHSTPASSTDGPDRPRRQPPGHHPFRVTGPDTSAYEHRSPRAHPTALEQQDALAAQQDALAAQLAAQSAQSALAEQWRAAGLGRHDQHIIEQCQRDGLTPQDVRRRVDGQTVASRLKNGESISSVRSRMDQSD